MGASGAGAETLYRWEVEVDGCGSSGTGFVGGGARVGAAGTVWGGSGVPPAFSRPSAPPTPSPLATPAVNHRGGRGLSIFKFNHLKTHDSYSFTAFHLVMLNHVHLWARSLLRKLDLFSLIGAIGSRGKSCCLAGFNMAIHLTRGFVIGAVCDELRSRSGQNINIICGQQVSLEKEGFPALKRQPSGLLKLHTVCSENHREIHRSKSVSRIQS